VLPDYSSMLNEDRGFAVNPANYGKKGRDLESQVNKMLEFTKVTLKAVKDGKLEQNFALQTPLRELVQPVKQKLGLLTEKTSEMKQIEAQKRSIIKEIE